MPACSLFAFSFSTFHRHPAPARLQQQQSTHAVLNYLVFNHGSASTKLSFFLLFSVFFLWAWWFFRFSPSNPLAVALLRGNNHPPHTHKNEAGMINDRFALSLFSCFRPCSKPVDGMCHEQSKTKSQAETLLEMKFDFVPAGGRRARDEAEAEAEADGWWLRAQAAGRTKVDWVTWERQV